MGVLSLAARVAPPPARMLAVIVLIGGTAGYGRIETAAAQVAPGAAARDSAAKARRAVADTVKAKRKGGAQQLGDVVVTAAPPVGAIGVLPDVFGNAVYAGKKTEVILLDSLTANTAQDVTRELIARVPGANISETEGNGFPSNGIGYRGLNPVQSIELNTRQNGINIAADLYGYPETYYTPPMEAVQRIELIRGAASLQFGPQFGGVVNYVIREGQADSKPTFTVRQSFGSFNSLGTYLGVRGGSKRWVYTAYVQGRLSDGWRPNSDLKTLSGYGKLKYIASDKLSISGEYTFLRNRLQMPGGLTNDEFNEDPRQSTRARNWIQTPWNIAALSLDWRISPSVRLTSALSYMFSERSLVWRSEDGGPEAVDAIDPATGTYVPREVEREYFNNLMNETRLTAGYTAFGGTHTLAAGVRAFRGRLRRQEGGVGTTGSNYDLTLVEPYDEDVVFYTTNLAAFVENVFRIGDKLSVTPGARVEYLHSTAAGFVADSSFSPQAKNRAFLLGGVGAQYRTSSYGNIYANITQAYRPIEYSFLVPFGTVSRVNPNIKDPRGFNADVGIRGTFGQVLTYDVSAFLISYHNRIGLISGADPDGTPYTERTNVANSLHKGVEAYVDFKPFGHRSWGDVGIYNSFAYTDAKYTSGDFDGNRVEYAPKFTNRVGLTYGIGGFKATLQATNVSSQFGDANNTVASYTAIVGLVPAYQVFDLSARYRFSRYSLAAGINNLRNHNYFTLRADEYPGPGIIPGIGRSLYTTLTAEF